jgi:hypothetical protein
VKSRANQRTRLELVPEVESAQQLDVLMANVKKLTDVLDIYRVTSAAESEPAPHETEGADESA